MSVSDSTEDRYFMLKRRAGVTSAQTFSRLLSLVRTGRLICQHKWNVFDVSENSGHKWLVRCTSYFANRQSRMLVYIGFETLLCLPLGCLVVLPQENLICCLGEVGSLDCHLIFYVLFCFFICFIHLSQSQSGIFGFTFLRRVR